MEGDRHPMNGGSSSSDREGAPPIRKIADASHGKPPSGRVRRRLVRAKRWFLLDANRWVVTGILSLATFLLVVTVGVFGPVPVESFLDTGISPGSILVELLKVIVSVVVIVLSINQLVLSPGLGSVGDQESRFEETMQLRERIEERTDVEASPSSPANAMAVLVASIANRARELREVTADADGTDPRFEADVASYAEGVAEEADTVEGLLAGSHFGSFDVMSASMRFAISEKVRTLRFLRERYGDSLSPTEAELFEEVSDLLELFTVVREYLKTAYIRSEYIELSQGLLYLGLPSVVLTYCAAQTYAPGAFPGRSFGVDHGLLFVSGAVTVALAPFALLLAYVFRLATLSRSTVFIGPFAARSTHENRSDGGERRGT